jgi:hypothetical protein
MRDTQHFSRREVPDATGLQYTNNVDIRVKKRHSIRKWPAENLRALQDLTISCVPRVYTRATVRGDNSTKCVVCIPANKLER